MTIATRKLETPAVLTIRVPDMGASINAEQTIQEMFLEGLVREVARFVSSWEGKRGLKLSTVTRTKEGATGETSFTVKFHVYEEEV